jgi:osmotically-inducible protein OsmY
MTLLKRCSLFFAAASLALVLGCASNSKQESTGELLDDSVITSKVKAAIFAEPSLKVLHINVETTKNVVQLSGDVSSRDEMDKAVEVTRAVGGVRSVKNDLQLRK